MAVPEDRAGAVARYVAIAKRLPKAGFPPVSRHADHLADLVDDIDVFVLDGFGVLNIGDDAIPGAVERINALKQQGKKNAGPDQWRYFAIGHDLPEVHGLGF